MERLFKAIGKVVVYLILILVTNFTLDFITGLVPWIAPILLILAIIALVVVYYYENEEENDE